VEFSGTNDKDSSRSDTSKRRRYDGDKEKTFVRSADQQFAEIDESWEKFVEKLEKETSANPNNLTSSIEDNLVKPLIEFRTKLSRGKRLLTNKKNPETIPGRSG